MEKVWVAKVAVSTATYAFDRPFDYILPASLVEKAAAGIRAMVPFGRGNRITEAMILQISQEEKRPELKTVSALLDDAPVLDQESLRLAYWMRERYFCTVYDAIKTILPAGLWYCIREIYHIVGGVTPQEAGERLKGREKAAEVYAAVDAEGGRAELEALKKRCGEEIGPQLKLLVEMGLLTSETAALRKISDKMARRVTLSLPPEEALAAVEGRKRSAPLRYEVIRLLSTVGSALSNDICYFTGASSATLKSLEKSGLVKMVPEEVYRVPPCVGSGDGGSIVLNHEQEEVCRGILGMTREEEAGCALLFGVTGSGKTMVYIYLLQQVVAQGKTGIILVPEIALTPQMMEKFSHYFGDKVVMLHSSLRMSERYDQWKRIRRGEVQVVLGTRSAVFAPLKNIGMIILDEEQESSYQSENLPRYHARDVAKYRCGANRAVLLLGSATPTVESAYYARTGRYQQFFLRYRYNARPLPQVMIADMRKEVQTGNSGVISMVLREQLEKNLEKGEQSILFLNRRGNSRMLLCGECGKAPQCPRCSVPLTYHSVNHRLMCHYCGYSQQAMERCPDCGGLMKYVGVGTQRVEEELHGLFPGAEVLRMDADTVSGGHEKILSRFARERIPILLGTQMVAKGLDFEGVTLVGVLAADLSLYVDNFRASERTFSLLTQVVGRAGRGSKPGRAVIQTFTPDNEVILSAARQDYDAFYDGEIRMRRIRREPPFADLFTLTVSGHEEEKVLRAAAALRAALREDVGRGGVNRTVEIVGPAPAPVLKVNNRFRYRIFWVGRNDYQTRERLAYYTKMFYSQRENRKLNLLVDCNALD